MSSTAWAWLLLGLYAAVTIWLAIRGARRTRTIESFAVGSRSLPPSLVGLSLAAQLTSVATFVVNPGLVFAYGTPALLGLAGAASLGIICGLVLLSKAFRAAGQREQALTIPGWLGARYSSKGLQVGFALLSLLLVTFVVMILVAMTYVLVKLLGVPGWAALAGVILFVFPYVLLGGVNTSVYTNSVQAAIMVGVAVALIASGLGHFEGGISAMLARLSTIDAKLVGLVNSSSPYFRTLLEVFVCNFIVGFALVCQPHVLTKSLYLRDEKQVNRYLLTAIVVGIVFAGVMLVGLYGRFVLPAGTRIDLVVPTYIATQFSPLVRVIIGVGVLCAGLSTLEGLLLALSATLAADLFRPLLRREAVRAGGEIDEAQLGRDSLRHARLAISAVAVLSFGLALGQMTDPSGGSVAIFAQYGIYCVFSASFAPMLFGLFVREVPRPWAIASAITALSVYLGMSIARVSVYANNPAVLSACAIASSLAVIGCGVLLTRWRRRRLALAADGGGASRVEAVHRLAGPAGPAARRDRSRCPGEQGRRRAERLAADARGPANV